MDKEYLGKITPKKNYSIKEIFDSAILKESEVNRIFLKLTYEKIHNSQGSDPVLRTIVETSLIFKEGVRYKIYENKEKNCYEVETEIPNSLSFDKHKEKPFYIGDYFDLANLENGVKS